MPAKIVANGHDHLWKLVRAAIDEQGCTVDLNHIDVSYVTDFSLMFDSLPFSGDVSAWNVSRARDMSCMFENSPFNGDVSRWDVSNVENMSFMFARTSYNRDLSTWNVAKVRDMRWMFRCNTAFQQDLSTWNTSGLKDADGMFQHSAYAQNLSSWPLDNLETFDDMLGMESLQRMPQPCLYHWYALLDHDAAVRGHAMEQRMRDLADAASPVLQGLGLSHMKAAHWLHHRWKTQETLPALSLPALDL